jgi:hypothetical protein
MNTPNAEQLTSAGLESRMWEVNNRGGSCHVDDRHPWWDLLVSGEQVIAWAPKQVRA